MNRNEYFLKALKAKKFAEKFWVMQMFAVTRLINMDDVKLTEMSPWTLYLDGKEYMFKDDDNVLHSLDGKYDPNKPPFEMYGEIKLKANSIPGVKKDITTTLARLTYNYIVYLYPFNGKIEYINERVDIKKVEGKMVDMLVNKEITIEELDLYYKGIFHTGSYTQIFSGALSEKAFTTSPEIIKRRNELLKENKDNITDGTVISNVEKELTEMDKDFVGDGAYRDFLDVSAGKSFGVTRKQSFIMHGGEANLEGTGLDVIPQPLSDGISMEHFPSLVNSLRSGAYKRGKETALGGEAVKFFMRIFQNARMEGDDCKVQHGYKLFIDDYNFKSYVGRYLVGKDKPLTEDDLAKLKGKEVELRSAAFCKTPGTNYCAKCLGDKVAANGTLLPLLVSEAGSSWLGISMAATHGTVLTTANYDLDDVLS